MGSMASMFSMIKALTDVEDDILVELELNEVGLVEEDVEVGVDCVEVDVDVDVEVDVNVEVDDVEVEVDVDVEVDVVVVGSVVGEVVPPPPPPLPSVLVLVLLVVVVGFLLLPPSPPVVVVGELPDDVRVVDGSPVPSSEEDVVEEGSVVL